eukprot:m.134017 g.134017  ORF g.134017 m.134017 type:complete len:302 (-) comp16526_c0_seq3:224-1129(-)
MNMLIGIFKLFGKVRTEIQTISHSFTAQKPYTCSGSGMTACGLSSISEVRARERRAGPAYLAATIGTASTDFLLAAAAASITAASLEAEEEEATRTTTGTCHASCSMGTVTFTAGSIGLPMADVGTGASTTTRDGVRWSKTPLSSQWPLSSSAMSATTAAAAESVSLLPWSMRRMLPTPTPLPASGLISSARSLSLTTATACRASRSTSSTSLAFSSSSSSSSSESSSSPRCSSVSSVPCRAAMRPVLRAYFCSSAAAAVSSSLSERSSSDSALSSSSSSSSSSSVCSLLSSSNRGCCGWC